MSLIEIDRRILLLVQRYRPPQLTLIFILLTYSGTGRSWLIAATILNVMNISGMRFVEAQNSFLNSLLSPLLAWGLSLLFKRLFARRRPMASAQGLKPLIETPSCGSFPSGHTATSFAFFFALTWVNHPLAPWIGVWAALVSFSRLYLGVHYLSDILGGVVLGLASAATFIATNSALGW